MSNNEIVQMKFSAKKVLFIFDKVEHPNPRTTLETLVGLRPVFKKDGTETAGNASSLNDGASSLHNPHGQDRLQSQL